MSRRKQQKPRHLDADEEATDLLPREESSAMDMDDVTDTDQPESHACANCRMTFYNLSDLVDHNRTCERRPNIFVGQGMMEGNPGDIDTRNLGTNDSEMDDDDEDDDESMMGDDDDYDDDDDRDQNPATSPVVIRPIGLDPAKVKASPDQGQEGADPDDPLAVLPNNNVTLESLENTKVAVAQFAENNLDSSDLMVLQSTLYNLQQQQLFQLQLLQQLQQHIVMGANPSQLANLPLPNFAPAGVNPAVLQNMQKNLLAAAVAGRIGGLPAAAAALGLNLNPQMCSSAEDGSPDTEDSVTGNDSQDSAPCSPVTPAESLETGYDVIKPMSDVSGGQEVKGLPGSPTTKSALMGMTELANMAQFNKDKSPSNDVTNSSPGNSTQKTYAADDPYFKYKCRFCHKVFGSDSALQIHIRSHTGERPFKCNICGNRFTTRGNLKVHFTRHKDQYPHVKMNPNPIPEHLDRMPVQPPMMPVAPMVSTPLPMAMPVPLMSTGAPLPQNMPPLIPMMPKPPFLDIKPQSEESSHKEQAPTIKQQPPRTPSPKPKPKKESPKEDAPSTPRGIKRELSPDSRSPVRAMVIQPTGLGAPGAPPPLTSAAHTPFTSSSLPMPPMPMPSPLLPHGAPMMPFGFEGSPGFGRNSILPLKNEDPLEQYMEVQKSETSKLEQLVKNLETKLTDPNQCAICQRILSCKSALQMHYRTHTGERPFKCKICSRAFTTKGNLKTHMGVHRAKPPMRMLHQCPVCHKQFTNSMVLQQHIRMHTGEAPKSMPHPMPMPNDMMMAAQAMNGMPFPGFPFYPPGMPGFPQMPMNLGGMDLRKVAKEGDEGVKEKDEDEKNEDDNLTVGDDEYGKYSGDEDEMFEDEDDYSDDKDGMDLQKPEGEDTFNQQEPISPRSDKESSERDVKSPYGNTIPSPPTLVPVKPSESPAPKESKVEYISPYSEPLTPGIQGNYSSSLLALEERVKAIDCMDMKPLHFGINKPLEQIENKPADNYGRENRRDLNGSYSPAQSDDSYGSGKGTDDGGFSAPVTPPNKGFPFMPFPGGDLSPRSFEAATGKPDTTCDICFKTFACKSALQIHYRSHTKDRPYHCDVCDRTFSTRGNMRQHMLTHKIRDLPEEAFNEENQKSGSSPSGSAQSAQNTSSSSASSNSSSNGGSSATVTPPASSVEGSKTKSPAHTPPSAAAASGAPTSSSPFVRKPNLRHMCTVCQKPFSSASALQIHMRTHTGDKPFKCNVCGKAFTTKGNLKVHMGTHMWNNAPSRRGRRMSVEGIPGVPQKDRDFFHSFAHRGPSELFPYPFPGMPPHAFPPKMNEISVIQNANGGMAHLPASAAAEAMLNHFNPMMKPPMMPHNDMLRKPEQIKSEDKIPKEVEANNNSSVSDFPPSGTNGELDLSIRKHSPTEASHPASSTAPLSASSPKIPKGDSAANPTWLWKTTCHLCNKVCPSIAALDMHMRSHLPMGASPGHLSPKPLLA